MLVVLARMLSDEEVARPLVRLSGVVECVHCLQLMFHKHTHTHTHPSSLSLFCLLPSLPQEWYRSFDHMEDGYISWLAVHHAAQTRGLSLSDKEVDDLIHGVGVLKAGVITYTEFVAATTPRTVYLDVRCAVTGVLSLWWWVRSPSPCARFPVVLCRTTA